MVTVGTLSHRESARNWFRVPGTREDQHFAMGTARKMFRVYDLWRKLGALKCSVDVGLFRTMCSPPSYENFTDPSCVFFFFYMDCLDARLATAGGWLRILANESYLIHYKVN